MKIRSALLAAWTLAGAAQASQQMPMCLRESDGKLYTVTARQLTGSELNTATSKMTYAPLSYYVVVFWTGREATVIDIGAFPLTTFASSGRDQQGRSWQVWQRTGACV